MLRRRAERRAKRTGKERGAVLVELTIVIPLLMTILLGIFEIGMAWAASQTVVQASRGGARTVSQLGVDNAADQSALRSVKATFAGEFTGIQRVVVWEVPVHPVTGDPTSSVPPALCLTSAEGSPPASENCNVYFQTDLNNVGNAAHFDSLPADPLSCGTGASANWCPGGRDDRQRTADYVGMYVIYERDWLTGFFIADTHTISQTTIMRIEPRTT